MRSYMLLLAISMFAVPLTARADSEGLSIASRLPVEVSEVVSGGSWVEGTGGGFYRTVSVTTYVPDEVIEVYLQWVGWQAPGEPLSIISSVPLKEFNEKKLFSASISLDTDVPSQTRITINGQDAEGRPDAMMVFLATLPGRYQSIPAEPEKDVAKH